MTSVILSLQRQLSDETTGDGLVTISSQRQLNDEQRQELLSGVDKTLTIVYKPFGGNETYLYNEQLVPILDDAALYSSHKVIFTNQNRIPGKSLKGFIIFNMPIRIQGSLRGTRLALVSTEGDRYDFDDEYSFFLWQNKEIRSFHHAEIYSD